MYATCMPTVKAAFNKNECVLRTKSEHSIYVQDPAQCLITLSQPEFKYLLVEDPSYTSP